jgi:glycosyltransferase involved in cell wall biosynthesis
MRILYSHRIQSHDGQGVHVEEMVAALREAGHEVRVVGPSAFAAAEFGGSDRRIDALRRRLPRMVGEIAELAYNLAAIPRLTRAWREFQPDLVYERYNLFHLAGSWLAWRHGALLYLEVNSPLVEERSRHGGLRLQALARRIERATWRAADRVLPVTGVLAAIIAARGVDPARLTVVPNAIVPDRFPDRVPQAAADTPVPCMGFVGFVRDWHGLDAVLDAMAADPLPLDLVVVGEGPGRPALERQAAALQLGGRVRFLGLVAHAQVPALLAGFAIALQPRVTDYASPLKIFEYMAAGCAIVAPDQPNIREILTHGETALLFDPAQPGAMWTAVRQLAGDAALRARLGAAARARALEHHTWAGNARRVVTLAAADPKATANASRRRRAKMTPDRSPNDASLV